MSQRHYPPPAGNARNHYRLAAGLGLPCVSLPAFAARELTEIFGLTLYSYGWVMGFAQVIAVVTFFVGIVRYRDRAPRAMLKATARLVAAVVAIWLFVINADLFWNSYRASALCRSEGGLHVYGQAEVAGLLSNGFYSFDRLGFSYLERYQRDGRERRKVRWTMRDGERVVEPIGEFQSRYEFSGDYETIDTRIKRSRYYVRDRISGEILSEYIRFHIRPSWYETFISGLLPAEGTPWHCSHGMPVDYVPLNGKRAGMLDAIAIALHPEPRTEAQP